jgi:hypothetical protein
MIWMALACFSLPLVGDSGCQAPLLPTRSCLSSPYPILVGIFGSSLVRPDAVLGVTKENGSDQDTDKLSGKLMGTFMDFPFNAVVDQGSLQADKTHLDQGPSRRIAFVPGGRESILSDVDRSSNLE